jgi:hypothetical protein
MPGFDFDDGEPDYVELERKRKAGLLNQDTDNKSRLLSQPEVPNFRQPVSPAKINQGGGNNTGNTAAPSTVNTPPAQEEPEIQEVQADTDTSSPANAVIDTALVDAAAKPAPIDIAAAADKPVKKAKTSKPVPKAKTEDTENLKSEYVRSVPSGVLQAMRVLFPVKLSNADLISAFAYIHTGGTCRISKEAMEAVKVYTGNKEILDIVSELAGIRRSLKSLSEASAAAEMGTAFIISDRLFSATTDRAKVPKDLNIRLSIVLDVLETLRKSARNQMTLDAETRGREIHKAKSRHDYNGK